MAAPPYLAIRARNGTNAAVYRLLSGDTLSKVGGDVGSSNMETNHYNETWCNRVVEFQGDLYCWQQNVIYKYNSGTDSWDTEHTVSDQNSQNGYRSHSGLYHINVDGTPSLIGVYRGNVDNNSRRYLKFDGSTWSSGLMLLNVYWSYAGPCFVYRNTLWFGEGNGTGTRVYQWDPSAGTLTTYTPDNLGDSSRMSMGSFCAFQGDLYIVAFWDSSYYNKAWILWKLDAGAFTRVMDVGGSVSGISSLYTGTGNDGQSMRPALFATDSAMYALVFGADSGSSTNAGTYCFKYAFSGGSLVESDITDPVVPSGLRQEQSSGIEHRWYPVVDVDTDPTSPTFHLYYEQSWDSGSLVYYSWQGEASELGDGTTVATYGIAVPVSQVSAGEYAWTSGEPHVEIEDMESGVGGMTISFKAYGGGTGHTVKFYWDDGEGLPSAQATLTGAATGGSATRSGNTVTNVSGDGSTTYTILWDFNTDGAALGDRFSMMPYIS